MYNTIDMYHSSLAPQGYISSIFHFFLFSSFFFSFSNHPHANGSLPLQPSPICLPEPDPVKSAQADDEDEKEGPYHCNDKPDRKYSQCPTRYQKFGCPRRGWLRRRTRWAAATRIRRRGGIFGLMVWKSPVQKWCVLGRDFCPEYCAIFGGAGERNGRD